MSAPKSIDAYPPEFWQIAQAVGQEMQDYELSLAAGSDAIRLRLYFYGFRVAMRRAVAGWRGHPDELRRLKETLAGLEQVIVKVEMNLIRFSNINKSPVVSQMREEFRRLGYETAEDKIQREAAEQLAQLLPPAEPAQARLPAVDESLKPKGDKRYG
jgi:hypothetical protein